MLNEEKKKQKIDQCYLVITRHNAIVVGCGE